MIRKSNIQHYYSTRVPPRKTFRVYLRKTFTGLGAHYAGNCKTIGVCAVLCCIYYNISTYIVYLINPL